jgi:hypothetical protein
VGGRREKAFETLFRFPAIGQPTARPSSRLRHAHSRKLGRCGKKSAASPLMKMTLTRNREHVFADTRGWRRARPGSGVRPGAERLLRVAADSLVMSRRRGAVFLRRSWRGAASQLGFGRRREPTRRLEREDAGRLARPAISLVPSASSMVRVLPGATATLPNSDSCACKGSEHRNGQSPQRSKRADQKAGCGKTARPVWREGPGVASRLLPQSWR